MSNYDVSKMWFLFIKLDLVVLELEFVCTLIGILGDPFIFEKYVYLAVLS